MCGLYVFPYSPCCSKSLLWADGCWVWVSKMAPQFPAGIFSDRILLCLKCHLGKNLTKHMRSPAFPLFDSNFFWLGAQQTWAKWPHVESSGTGMDASTGKVVPPIALPRSLAWWLYAATANTYFWLGCRPSTFRTHSPETTGTWKQSQTLHHMHKYKWWGAHASQKLILFYEISK